jgi:hypothetical protein
MWGRGWERRYFLSNFQEMRRNQWVQLRDKSEANRIADLRRDWLH